MASGGEKIGDGPQRLGLVGAVGGNLDLGVLGRGEHEQGGDAFGVGFAAVGPQPDVGAEFARQRRQPRGRTGVESEVILNGDGFFYHGFSVVGGIVGAAAADDGAPSGGDDLGDGLVQRQVAKAEGFQQHGEVQPAAAGDLGGFGGDGAGHIGGGGAEQVAQDEDLPALFGEFADGAADFGFDVGALVAVAGSGGQDAVGPVAEDGGGGVDNLAGQVALGDEEESERGGGIHGASFLRNFLSSP